MLSFYLSPNEIGSTQWCFFLGFLFWKLLPLWTSLSEHNFYQMRVIPFANKEFQWIIPLLDISWYVNFILIVDCQVQLVNELVSSI